MGTITQTYTKTVRKKKKPKKLKKLKKLNLEELLKKYDKK